MRSIGSYHVNQWFCSILQKFRGFKLICKYNFMHKVKKKKKAYIIIETNKPISYIHPAQIGLFLTQCFLEYAADYAARN